MIAFKIRRISALLGSDIISLFYQQFTLSIPSYQQYMFFFPLFCQQCTLSFRCLPKVHTVSTHCREEPVSDIRSVSTMFQVMT